MENKKEFMKLLGIINEERQCEHCHENIRFQIVLGRQWIKVLIPLIPISKQYYFVCPICNQKYPITRKEARKYLDIVASERKNHTKKRKQ